MEYKSAFTNASTREVGNVQKRGKSALFLAAKSLHPNPCSLLEACGSRTIESFRLEKTIKIISSNH